MKDGKYVVFPLSAWLEEWKQHPDTDDAPHPLTDLQRHRLDDAVVIRTKDIFAGPALHAYAANISTAISILRSVSPPFTDVADELQRVADYFSDAAAEADEIAGTLPTP